MRYVRHLITQVRKQTENEDVTDFTGIQNSEFLQYLNDAQHNLQALITQMHPNIFVKESVIPLIVNKDKYDIPLDCYLGNKLLNVEYSSTTREEDYTPLSQDSIKNRNKNSIYRYIRLDGQIVIKPKPTTGGSLRVTYINVVDELDLRRGLVSSAPTISSTGTWVLSVNDLDQDSLDEHEYICIVDKKGNTIAKNLSIASLGSSQLTLDAYTPSDSDSSILSGHYIVGGKNTSTHGSFDNSVERYLLSYCAWKILKRDSSMDSVEAVQELERMAREIVDSYGLISDDLQLIPDINEEWGE